MFSRRRTISLLAGGSAMFLSACSGRGRMAVVADVPADASVYPVFVSSNRTVDDNNYAGLGRAESLNFTRFDVSIPAERETGRIQYPSGNPDPNREFVTTRAGKFRDEEAFVTGLRQQLRRLPAGERDLILFVHGYNTNLAEGVYRLAQMDHDLKMSAVPVYFSWPTAERVVGYVHDRDSALYSRADFLRTLDLVRRANPDQVIVMAHSMGGFLVAEAMIQMDLREPGSVPRYIDSLVMMSPDIDVDLAVTQLNPISRLPEPFIVFTSQEDKALRTSERLTGRNPRLGLNPDVARFADVEVTFLDVTAFSERDAGDYGHLTLGSSQALIDLVPQLREAAASLDAGIAGNPGILPGTVLSVRRATEVVLTPNQ